MTSYPASQRWICLWPLQSLFLLSEGGWLLDGCDSAEVGWLTDDWPVSGTTTPPTCLATTSSTAYRSLHNTASVCSSGLWLTSVHNGNLGGHKHQRTDLCTILQVSASVPVAYDWPVCTRVCPLCLFYPQVFSDMKATIRVRLSLMKMTVWSTIHSTNHL